MSDYTMDIVNAMQKAEEEQHLAPLPEMTTEEYCHVFLGQRLAPLSLPRGGTPEEQWRLYEKREEDRANRMSRLRRRLRDDPRYIAAQEEQQKRHERAQERARDPAYVAARQEERRRRLERMRAARAEEERRTGLAAVIAPTPPTHEPLTEPVCFIDPRPPAERYGYSSYH